MNDDTEPSDELNIPALPESELEALEGDAAADSKADAEAQSLSGNKTREELREDAEIHEHHRSEHFKEVFEKLFIWSMYAMFAAMAILGVIWLWHIASPPCWRWLNGDQVTILQDILTGGIIAGLVAEHFRRRMGG